LVGLLEPGSEKRSAYDSISTNRYNVRYPFTDDNAAAQDHFPNVFQACSLINQLTSKPATKMQELSLFFIKHYQLITVVILSIFLGIEVISRVPSVLHTPLMSGANAIHGVVIIGAIIVMGSAPSDDYLALTLGFLAVVLGTLNVVGGFVVTDRMLEMFGKKKKR